MPKLKRFVWRIKQKAATPPSPPPSWVELSREITADILRRLGIVEILLNAERVCSTWWNVCHDPSMWRSLTCEMTMICTWKMSSISCAASPLIVARVSCSKLTSSILAVTICSSILRRESSQLRHLRLVSCDNISNGGLAAVAKNFPLLEELHIYLSAISKVDIEAVGRSCSQLKSFTLSDSGFRGLEGFRRLQIDVNDQAMAIAVNMSELRHLALFGNTMTNEGLSAILDGCPRPQSLDLRHCHSIDLKGDLGTRCH
ncbi:hypothetical protein P3S67_023436 [Capsicum chacoense]